MINIPVTFYYYLSFTLVPLLGLVQTKILTTILLPKDFGEIQLILPLLGWVVIIGGMGTPQYVVRFYSRDGISVYQEGLFISIVAIIIIGLIGCLYLMFFGWDFQDLKISIRIATIFLVAALSVKMIDLIKALLRVQERHLLYNCLSIFTKIFLLTGVTIGVISSSGAHIEGYLMGTAIACMTILIIIFAISQTNSLLKLKIPSWPTIKEIFSYGFPIVCIALLGSLLPNLNRYVIFSVLGTASVAKYAIGIMVTTLCFQTIYEPLNTILHPRVFKEWEKGNKGESRAIINRFLNQFIIVGVIAGGMSTRFEDILLNIVADINYRLPTGCFGILLLSNFLLGIYRFISIHYFLKRNTIELGIIFSFSIIVNIAVAMLFIDKIGLLGAAISVLIGMLILAGSVFLRGKQSLRIRIFPRYIIPAILISLLLIILPHLSAWNIYSPLRWIDVIVSIIVAGCCTYFLTKRFSKNYRLLVVQEDF